MLGCCVLRCEGRADMSSLFLAGWRVALAVCRPWFSQLKVRVTLRCLLLVSRALSRGGSLMIGASVLRALLVQIYPTSVCCTCCFYSSLRHFLSLAFVHRASLSELRDCV